MGAEPIPTRRGRTDASWWNRLREALSGDFVPRKPNGDPADRIGTLGTSSLKWLRAHVAVGHWAAGDVKIHHSFNGVAGPGQGWMLCDGRQVTQAAYDAEHGAGSWATYVGSSPLANKYLPNMTDKYAVGVAATTQAGSSALTAAGNSNNAANLLHGHLWYEARGVIGADVIYDSNGNPDTLIELINPSAKAAGAFGISGWDGSGTLVPSHTFDAVNNYLYTSKDLSNDISPDSVAVQFYMRVVG